MSPGPSRVVCALVVSALGSAALAQEKPERPKKTPTPLKVDVVFARHQGERQLSRLPYTLSLSADDRPARLRMGIQVPITMKDTPGQTVYRDVGNNLDCSAESADDGRFKLSCSFEQSSVYAGDGERRAGSAVGDVPVGTAPLIRNFRSETNLLLRDGQTATYVAATDPVSGDVLTIDVTLRLAR